MSLNESAAIAHLMDLLRVPGLSGRERPVADAITAKLLAVGCERAWIQEDDAHTRIPRDFEMGNLIVKLPGTRPGPRLLFAGHMDTVPLTRGAVPVRQGERIVPQGDTALGADNRTACAAIVTLVETLLTQQIPHPPLTLLFTVGEEIGLWGAREVKPEALGNPALAFNIDSGNPEVLTTGAIGAQRWDISVRGIAAHAGVHPEQGVSAALIAARAISDIASGGYFGAIDIDGRRGTSNVGVLQGGEATNQVTDLLLVKGESRSHDPEFLEEISQSIFDAFRRAAAGTRNQDGQSGSVEIHCERDYQAFRIPDDAPVVELARRALGTLGLPCHTRVTNGGLDANYFNAKGLPTVTLGAGQHNPHTQKEYADLPEYLNGCRLLLEIVREALRA